MKKSKIDEGRGYRIFTVFNTILMIAILIATAYPVYYVLIASISAPQQMAANYGLMLAPKFPLSVRAYEMVFKYPLILTGYANTLFIVVAGLAVNMVMTILGAYFMTLNKSMLHKPVAVLILFSMYFSGGMVPTYLNIKSLGLMDSLWSLIIPSAISTYNLLVLRSAFAAVPGSLVEAAVLDGASHFKILRHVMVPLSGATLAVIVLYYGVGHWNSWFNASIYIQSTAKFPLQLVLRRILILNQNAEMNSGMDSGEAAQLAELIKYALIVVSTAPILCLYPFLQRFFVKGVMVGAVKG